MITLCQRDSPRYSPRVKRLCREAARSESELAQEA